MIDGKLITQESMLFQDKNIKRFNIQFRWENIIYLLTGFLGKMHIARPSNKPFAISLGPWATVLFSDLTKCMLPSTQSINVQYFLICIDWSSGWKRLIKIPLLQTIGNKCTKHEHAIFSISKGFKTSIKS